VSGSFPAAVRDKLLYWSKELTPIYVIHWVLIGWLALFIGFNQLMFWQTILAMAIIVVAADRITAAYAGWQGRRRAAKPLATAR
jgi:hypothetical protein